MRNLWSCTSGNCFDSGTLQIHKINLINIFYDKHATNRFFFEKQNFFHHMSGNASFLDQKIYVSPSINFFKLNMHCNELSFWKRIVWFFYDLQRVSARVKIWMKGFLKVKTKMFLRSNLNKNLLPENKILFLVHSQNDFFFFESYISVNQQIHFFPIQNSCWRTFIFKTKCLFQKTFSESKMFVHA